MRFQLHKEKSKTGKQLFREKLLSDNGMVKLHARIQKQVQEGKGLDLKTVLWDIRDWQQALFPRMRFESFQDHAATVKTFKYDIGQTLEKAREAAGAPKDGTPQEQEGAADVDAAGGTEEEDIDYHDDPFYEYTAAASQAPQSQAPSQITYFAIKPKQPATAALDTAAKAETGGEGAGTAPGSATDCDTAKGPPPGPTHGDQQKRALDDGTENDNQDSPAAKKAKVTHIAQSEGAGEEE